MSVGTLLRRIREASPLIWIGIFLTGILLGLQINSPNRRILEAVAGLLVAVLAFRFHLSVGLSFLVFFLPFPTHMSFGSTTTAFTVLLFIVWIARISVGQDKPVGRTILDIPIILLLMAYMTSFYNAGGMTEIKAGLVNFGTVVGCVFMYYLIVNFVNDERALRTIVFVASMSCAMVLLISLYELFFPGKVLLPGWVLGVERREVGFMQTGIRVGGPFNDFELLAEYCAINIPIQLFMAVRAKSVSRKIAWIVLALGTTIVLHATITRGAFVAFWFGMAYLMTIARRDFDFKKVVGVAVLGVILFMAVNFVLQEYTRSGSVFERFSKETVLLGLVPAARAVPWTESLERAKEHLIIGHGPYYGLRAGVRKFFWPHNGYLFQLYVTGLFGLSAFVWLLVKLFRETLKFSSRSMASPEFARSLLLVMNVQLVIFFIDQTKIEFHRNFIYTYYVWFVFGLIVACSRIAKTYGAEVTTPTG